MPDRNLPVRPDLDQLKHQAKDLLRAIRREDPDALAELRANHPDPIDPKSAKLADAQLALARAYGAPSWTRLAQSCRMIDAIWRDDIDTVRQLVTANPKLIHEDARVRRSNWGPPMSYAANLGRDRIITMLHELGATDHRHAIDRAGLQSQIRTVHLLYALMGSPPLSDDLLGGPAYTLSASGTEVMLALGVRATDEQGRRLAPVSLVLETDSRTPSAKHRILELYVQHGVVLPDTPVMALHRGRIDLLDAHVRRDPDILRRTFSHEEIYPPELDCHDEVLATQGTPLKGTTLLHLCVDYDELEIARWLLDHGMNVDARADVDADGFGGHTALFGTVVSQPNFWMNYNRLPQVAPMTELLLARGADPNVRASLRKQLHPGYGAKEVMREFRDVTPRSWGERYHRKEFVSEPALKLIVERGGLP